MTSFTSPNLGFLFDISEWHIVWDLNLYRCVHFLRLQPLDHRIPMLWTLMNVFRICKNMSISHTYIWLCDISIEMCANKWLMLNYYCSKANIWYQFVGCQKYAFSSLKMLSRKYVYKSYIFHHHHHLVVPLARISLTLSHHFSLSFNTFEHIYFDDPVWRLNH